jgi:addiction module RelB/DinJ family antitoxin
MKPKRVSARIDKKTKSNAAKVLRRQHLTLSEAIRHFLAEVVRLQKMPVAFEPAPKIVSPRTLWRMKRASQARDRACAARGEFSKGQNLLISPKQARESRVRWPDARLDD